MEVDDTLRASNIQLVRDYIEAINTWDLEAMTRLTTEDVHFEVPFHPPGFKRLTEGRDVYIEVLKQASEVMIDGSENLHDIKIDCFASDVNDLIATYKSNMKLRSGTLYRNEYVSRFKIRDGRVSHFIEYFDSILLYQALGGTVGSLADVEGSELLPPSLDD